MAEVHPDMEVLGQFAGMNNPVRVRCKTCGKTSDPKPANLLGSKNRAPTGCRYCSNNVRKTGEEFVSRLAAVNPSVEALDAYPGSNKKLMRFRCKECGHVWTTSAQSALQGHGCKVCWDNRRSQAVMLSQDEFDSRIAEANPDVRIVGSYSGAHDTIEAECMKCGFRWHPIAWNLVCGSGCPACGLSVKTSFVERFILHALRAALGEHAVLARDKATIGRELDIYVPSRSIAVEPGSWYWHKLCRDGDLAKRRLCEEQGIRLITIYDSVSEDALAQFDGDDDVICYAASLGAKKNRGQLVELVYLLLDALGCDFHFSKDEWANVTKMANEHARLNDGSFRLRMLEKNPGITVLGEFVDQDEPILVRCNRGHEYYSTPRNLLAGCGCRKCADIQTGNRSRLSQDEFESRLAKRLPSVRALGDYRGMSHKVRVMCQLCGKDWSPRAGDLLRKGHKCR